MKNLPKLVLALCVAGCLYACRTMSQGSGIAAGAAAGSLVGPGGAAIGGVAGYYAGDAAADTMGADPQVTLSQAREILNQPGGVSFPEPWYMRWQTWLVVGLAIRFRRGLMAIVTNAATGGFSAAALSTVGTLIGGKLSDVAKSATAAHVDERRRKKKSPISNVVSETRPHP